jgi:hypothetical protein
MQPSNKVVNGLWIGTSLSKVELLTIHSFLAAGHSFRLWTYESIETVLPNNVTLCDANTIIPSTNVFTYKNTNAYGHGKGSVAGFSDIFRYKLLYEYGGWWVDMDVTCLKPLDFEAPYFFRNHHHLEVVGNVMKCPAKSELMLRCYEEAIQTIDENNTDWHKPIEILNRFIEAFGLQEYIVRDVSNHDQWEVTSLYILKQNKIPESWFFIHWQNEEWRSREIDKTLFYYKSSLAQLLAKFGLVVLPTSFIGKSINLLKFSRFKKIF